MSCEDTIIINGEVYIKQSSAMAPAKENMPYMIVRTYSAGVFAGYVESRNGKEVVMREARRLWQWTGAASLSQMAMEGTSNPSGCKFPCVVDRVELTEAIELLNCSAKALKSIKEVPVWKK